TAEDWKEFATGVDQELKKNENKLSTLITTTKDINRAWDYINCALKKSANQYIPQAKRTPATFHAFSKKATDLHLSLRNLSHTIRQLSMDTNTPKATLITITNNNINQINQKIHTNIPLLDATANV